MGSNSSLEGFEGILIGNRIPHEFFVTTGFGESDIAVHAGSYHLALKKADIESYNIICYSSILPKIAKKTIKPANLVHGSVMETIMAVGHFNQGELGSAGIAYGWLHDKETDEKFGGLVCESSGQVTEDDIKQELHASLQELYTNGFSEKYDLKNTELITSSFTPTKKHGTVLVALCFTNYLIPIINNG